MKKFAISLVALAAVSTVAFAEPAPEFDKGYISNLTTDTRADVNAFAVGNSGKSHNGVVGYGIDASANNSVNSQNR